MIPHIELHGVTIPPGMRNCVPRRLARPRRSVYLASAISDKKFRSQTVNEKDIKGASWQYPTF